MRSSSHTRRTTTALLQHKEPCTFTAPMFSLALTASECLVHSRSPAAWSLSEHASWRALQKQWTCSRLGTSASPPLTCQAGEPTDVQIGDLCLTAKQGALPVVRVAVVTDSQTGMVRSTNNRLEIDCLEAGFDPGAANSGHCRTLSQRHQTHMEHFVVSQLLSHTSDGDPG